MPLTSDAALAPRSLLRDDVYARLQAAIVDGTLLPGEQLRDQDLAARLGVSRTPVREALLRLGQAGLVVAAPGRSTTVAPLDVSAIRDAQAVVAAMHRLAVEGAVSALTDEQLTAMREANQRFASALERGDAHAALSADDDFHAVPVAAAANTALAEVLAQYTPVLRRLEMLRFESLEGKASVALHARLIELCTERDVAGAAAVSHETWESLRPLLATLEADAALEADVARDTDVAHEKH